MRINLRSQLFIGIGLSLFLVLLLGTLSYITSEKERAAEEWVTHTLTVKGKLQDINVGLKDNASGIRARRRYQHVDTLFSHINEQSVLNNMAGLKVLIKDNPVQRTQSDHLEKEVAGLFALWGQINPELTLTDPERERAFFLQEVTMLRQIEHDIKIMDERENDLLAQRRSRMSETLEFNNFSNIGGTLLILIVVIVLGRVITGEFKKRRGAELQLKDKLEELEDINAATALHNEVLNGAQGLMGACQRATDVSSFVQTTLDGILQFTGITSGIIYLSEEEQGQELIPVYHRGVPEDRIHVVKKQALLSKEPEDNKTMALVHDIPADFWHIEAVAGDILPGTIIYLYLRLRGKLLGVIELACFHVLNKKQEEFLRTVSGALSIRLSAMQMTEGRKQLFDELKLKQEILLNQQEELQQANDELQQQTQALQASEEELRVQEEELKQINAELEEKNDALEAAKEVMAIKAGELEQSGKYKSEFLANMSHELRTPLNSVLILANLLSDNKEQNLTAKQVEYARIISNSGSDLLKLINDILDLSKIEAGKIELMIEDALVQNMAEDMRQLFFALAEEKKIGFKVELKAGVPEWIATDRQRVEQVMKNLLSNAFKFTPENGNVIFSIYPDATGLALEVADTGIGIEPEKQSMIFEAFKQAEGSTNRKYGGTGLGLSISRELARLLGGKISVSSKPGQGSRFALHLPLQHTAAEVLPSPRSLSAALPKEIKDADGLDKTILIIEDDANFAAILRDFATERRYNTLTAGNGKEGLEMAQQYQPDAIILDLQMPVMDGWEVLKHLKNDALLRKIPVHVISAMDEVKAPQGSVAYVKKPVTKEGLERTFRQIAAHLKAEAKKILIFSASKAEEDNTLRKFISGLPEDVTYDMARSAGSLIGLAAENHYDCIIADIGSDLENGIDELQAIREHKLLAGVSLILLINTEISASDELRLRGISEAIVMKTMEAHRRLKDELELFLFKVKEQPLLHMPPAAQNFTDSNVLSGKRVLVADDDMRNVFALVSLLENQHMEVLTASNGKEAVELLDNGEKVDVVLMDIMMPEMDGYEAMRQLRARPVSSRLPIIALTAKAMAEDRELCIAAGASDYMSKPIDTQKLLSLLRIWLS